MTTRDSNIIAAIVTIATVAVLCSGIAALLMQSQGADVLEALNDGRGRQAIHEAVNGPDLPIQSHYNCTSTITPLYSFTSVSTSCTTSQQ